MNPRDPLERMVKGYMADDAMGWISGPGPDDAIATTSRLRPYPRWLALMKEPPMRISSRVRVGSPAFRLALILSLTLALALAGAAAVVAAASLLPARPVSLPAPFGPARNGSLTFDKNGDIYLADANGTNARAIIAGDAQDRFPGFTRDGTHILFGRGPDDAVEVYMADADGMDIHRIASSFPDWSDLLPSDREVAEVRSVDGHPVLSVLELDGSGTIRVLDIGGIEPYWWVLARPTDGTELIFAGHPFAGAADVGLYGIKPDGTGLRSIGASWTTSSDNNSSFNSPVITPDGKSLAFWHLDPAVEGTERAVHIHLRDLTTGADLPVPFTGSSSTEGFDPQFSPDGRMVVFTRPVSAASSQWQLYVASVDGSQPARPIGPDHPGDDNGGFTFSPDGDQVILNAQRSTWLIDVATGKSTWLPGFPGLPSWQRLP